MTRIAPVNLDFNPKTLWFDARDLELAKGQPVVVLTARGVEFGHMAEDVFEASDEDIAKLKSELKPVKRLATPEDEAQAAEMARLSKEALPVFRELAVELQADMRPVSVEYLLDGSKAIFYFESADRVDFRDMVKRLSSDLHIRVDMRQIGARDEARLVGGLGHCGQELCCRRLGGEFCPVSIRMAKEQDLSLNPQKISGICGRLMCCLRYEYDAYKDFHQRAPKQGATIQTPEGDAKVVKLDVPKEIVEVKVLETGKTTKVPLAKMDAPEEGARPKSVSAEAWQDILDEAEASKYGTALFMTSQFTEKDSLGEARAVKRNNANVKNATGSGDGSTNPSKGRGRAKKEAAPVEEEPLVKRKPRRRSTKVAADGEITEQVASAKEMEHAEADLAKRLRDRALRRKKSSSAESASDAASEKKQVLRPGHKSSGVQAAANAAAAAEASADARKPRRRRRGSGSGSGADASKVGGSAKNVNASKAGASDKTGNTAKTGNVVKAGNNAKPGAGKTGNNAKAGNAANGNGEVNASGNAGGNGNGGRKPRRRTRKPSDKGSEQ